MKYRTLGNTGLLVSEIGLGCEGFVDHDGAYVEALMDIADEAGINCIDIYMPHPEGRSKLGKALLGKRDKFVLQGHLCTIWQDGQYKRTRNLQEVQEGFEDLLTRLQTDHLEIGMIHYIDAMQDWEEVVSGPIMAYAKQLQQDGRIRHIGISSHNPEVAQVAVESGLIDVLLFSVNPCYDVVPANEDVDVLFDESTYASHLVNMDPQRMHLYETCQRLGVGITVMKAFGGGDLLDETLSPAGKALSVAQCIHYALTRPAVSSVMVGAHALDELRACVAYEDASEEEKDYATVFASMPNISWEGHCMYCGHCAPCPKGIEVATVMKFLNLCKAQRMVPETVREHYGILTHQANACIGCHMCEQRCPFHVSVVKHMEEAKELFHS